VNLGLRWEYNGSPVEKNNYEGSFNPNVNPATTFAVQQVGPGAPLTSFYNADYKDFSPRLGVAWDVKGNGKTVVREGASILRNPVVAGQYVGLSPFGANVPAIGLNTSGQAVNLHTPLQLALQTSQFVWSAAGPVFPGNASLTTTGSFAGTYTGLTCTYAGEAGLPAGYTPTPCTTQAVNPNFRQPYSAQWNLDIQRAITNSLTVDLAYIGVHGVHEATWVDINQPAIGAGWNTPTSTLPAALAANALPGGVSPAAFCIANPATNCGILGSKAQKNAVNGALAANEAASTP